MSSRVSARSSAERGVERQELEERVERQELDAGRRVDVLRGHAIQGLTDERRRATVAMRQRICEQCSGGVEQPEVDAP